VGTNTKAIDMKQFILITAAFFLSAGFVSCSKSDNPGDNAQPQVASMLTGTNRSSSLGGISKDSLTWSSAKAQATLVKFEAKSAGQEIEYKSNQQRSIDLFSSDPLAGNFQLPAGTYDEVELKTVLSPIGGQPSLELKGSFINGGTTIPVLFQSSASLEVKGEKKNITVDPGSNYDISTLVDLSLVFRGISATDLASATRTNGEIRISNAENSKLYNIITNNLNNLKDECEIHRH
jgi:hypothetical protein